MNAALQRLVTLVPPPVAPRNATGDWAALELEMGLIFPDDYKQFIGLYGTGTMCSLFEIDSPFRLSELYQTSVRDAWISRTNIYRQLDQFLDNPPAPSLYPDIPGLLPCVNYASGDIVGWLTNAAPEQWHIVYRDRENGYYELPQMGFVDFLVAAITGQVPMPEIYLSKDILSEPRTFEPY